MSKKGWLPSLFNDVCHLCLYLEPLRTRLLLLGTSVLVILLLILEPFFDYTY